MTVAYTDTADLIDRILEGGVQWITFADRPDAEVGTPVLLVPDAVVATARIADVVPIVADYDDVCHAYDGPAAVEAIDLGLRLYPKWDSALDEMAVDISDQLPYGDFPPDRWAWRLDDVRRLTEPVREYPDDPCRSCEADSGGWCVETGMADCAWDEGEPVPTIPVRGRQGVWRPDPALVAACGVEP